MIASNNGYRQKMPYANLLTHSLTHLLSYPKSRDAIASKNICTLLKTKKNVNTLTNCYEENFKI